jgi:transposase
MRRVTVGVDAGKRAHQVAAYDLATGRIVGQGSFSVSRTGFEQLARFLHEHASDQAEVLVGIEATGHYHVTLLEFLLERGSAVVLVNPYQAAQFRRSQGAKAKTDRIDARALARFVAVSGLRALSPTDARLVGLRELTRFRADLVGQRTTALNALHGALDLAFPELLMVFKQPASRTVLSLLEAFPTAAAMASASEQELVGCLQQAGAGRPRRGQLAALSEAARTSIAAKRLAVTLSLKVRALVRQIQVLDHEIAELEQAIEAIFAELGHAPNHFPVGSAVALAALVAEAGDPSRYRSAKEFVAHFGWCPTDVQSGMYKAAHPPLSKAGNRYARRTIWLLAIVAVRHNAAYRTYFDQRTTAGKNKMHTLVAIGRKLLCTVFAILRTGRPYDPAYQHSSALSASAVA